MKKEIKPGQVLLKEGMKVKIKNDYSNYSFNSGKIRTITKILPDFFSFRAFELNHKVGIWCISDFDYCVDFPNLTMI